MSRNDSNIKNNTGKPIKISGTFDISLDGWQGILDLLIRAGKIINSNTEIHDEDRHVSTDNHPSKTPPFHKRALTAARMVMDTTTSVDQAAKKMDIPEDIVRNTIKFLKEAPPDLIKRVEGGEMRIVDVLKDYSAPLQHSSDRRTNTASNPTKDQSDHNSEESLQNSVPF